MPENTLSPASVPSEELRVLIPRGLARLATRSGIGEAIRHQEKAVRLLGHEVVTDPREDFDVLHLNTPFPDTPALAAWAHRRRRPVFMWAHSTEDDFRDSFTGANAIAPLFRRWIASNYRRGDVVLTPTAYAKDLISTPSYGIEAPIHVLSNGVDTEFFRPDPAAHGALRQELGLPADAHVIMSVGLQMVRKGILEWVSLARRLPEVTFVWYGHTDKGMITREVARAVATAPANCVFPGHVAKDVLRIAYAGADAFLFLTHEETEGIVLLEALASGATTVVSDIPIYRDWLPEGTVTHKVHGHATQKVDEAVQLLGRLFAGELPDLSAAGRAAAEEVDMQRVAERLQQIYVSEGVRAHRV